MTLEIACFNIQSAHIAQWAGADRIELCEDYSKGGITPSFEKIAEAREEISIPLFVMIRPRSGDFIYSGEEFELMKQQVLFCKTNKINGVVFGMLDANGNIDVKRCKELVALASPMQVTFHRAFDEVKNLFDSLETLVECGFSRVLTSGQMKPVIYGTEIISSLIEKAKGRISIMPGGGIRNHNISEVKKKTGATEFHSAALNSETLLADETEIRKLKAIIG
jgi:copper homeostasis protein